jgi:hypothetical protein
LERSERKGEKNYKICERKKRFDEKQTVGYEKIREKKRYFVSIILKRDFKCERLEKEKLE